MIDVFAICTHYVHPTLPKMSYAPLRFWKSWKSYIDMSLEPPEIDGRILARDWAGYTRMPLQISARATIIVLVVAILSHAIMYGAVGLMVISSLWNTWPRCGTRSHDSLPVATQKNPKG